MSILQVNSWKDLLIHLGIILVIGCLLLLGFFYWYLPMSTNHGETITVPDVQGVALADLDDFLESRDLQFEVTTDSGFSNSQAPLTVLRQFPLPNSKVKENRKIYVTLNAQNPPLVRMPKLVGGSVKNALLVLKTYDLEHAGTKYVEDLAFNYVLEQRIDGRQILEGEKIPKGSKVELIAGNGLGNQALNSPNLLGLDSESAQFAIVGSGLKIGEIKYEKEGKAVIKVVQGDNVAYRKESVAPGSVFKQSPDVGDAMRLGQMVDIWIYRPDSINTKPTLLDEQ